jgi:hypothetical protein
VYWSRQITFLATQIHEKTVAKENFLCTEEKPSFVYLCIVLVYWGKEITAQQFLAFVALSPEIQRIDTAGAT